MTGLWSRILCAVTGLAASAAMAQVPFYYAGATAFDPQISVVNSGVILDAQATVSPDLKYVTITARPSNTSLLALQQFTFQSNAFAAQRNNPAVAAPGVMRLKAMQPGIYLLKRLDE